MEGSCRFPHGWARLPRQIAVTTYSLSPARIIGESGAQSRGDHTTVLRRVDAFEKQLAVRLFERLPTGYVLTASGEELIAAARDIDETVTTLERRRPLWLVWPALARDLRSSRD